MRWRLFTLITVLFVTVGLFFVASAVSPSGATVTSVSNSTAPADPAQGVPAIAGNVTELNIFGYSTTQSWQGYFGNVSGALRLADSSSNVLYNWSLASPQGEVYASNSSSITWGSVDCFDVSNTTAVNLLESEFGIAPDDVDGVNETFTQNNHAAFYTNSIEFTLGECNNVQLFNDVGVGTFDEVLLSDGTSTVFASLLEEDVVGFDGSLYDFQMLVLENGHSGDTATNTYYFWVELE